YWPFSVRESCTSNANPPNSDLPSFNTIWQGTADHLSISDSLVRRWVTKYRLHGESGIKRRKHTTKYSVEYKLEAIRLVTG
ncbi:TPA: hypothetical protein ACJJ9D_002110, partial [Neisseria meningitidis]